MGEKIRDLGILHLGKSQMMVELNKGTHKKGKYDIHVQNGKFRLNMTEDDFLKIATSILYAEENLKFYKRRHYE